MGYYGYLDHLFLLDDSGSNNNNIKNKLNDDDHHATQSSSSSSSSAAAVAPIVVRQQRQQEQNPNSSSSSNNNNFLSSMMILSLRIPYISFFVPRLHFFYGLITSLHVESKTCNGQCHKRRKQTWERFLQYLQEYGLLEEFRQGFLNLPFGVFINMFYLQRIQQVQADQIRNNNDILWEELRLSSKSSSSNNIIENNIKDNNNILSRIELEEVKRLMGYCTLSYGSSMMNAVVSATLVSSSSPPTTAATRKMRTSHTRRSSLLVNPAKSQRETLVRYNGLGAYSIEILADNPSLDTEYTGHYLVLDHQRKEAVLTIRGTFSIADLLTDLDVRTVPFCGGYAAIGFVTMANNIWTLLEHHLTTMIPEDYRLIITGHSLGGAVATLLTIKILYEQNLSKTKDIHCHAFGSPPVFGCFNETSQPIDEEGSTLALVRPHITNYIHQDDAVPFLRPLDVRKANASLCLMNQTRKNIISWSLWWRILFGINAATIELQEAFDKVQTSHSCYYYPNHDRKPEDKCMSDLKWASCKTIWFRKIKNGTSSDGYRYQATIHPHNRRAVLLQRGLLATRTMIHDHVPVAYERAIRYCLKEADTST